MIKKLGVNIDHVATLREARGEVFPSPIEAAIMCEKAGANSIVAHLREDRRHIQDYDIYALKDSVATELNMEMSIDPDIVKVACQVKPKKVTLVPERRQELTTEGGLNVIRFTDEVKKAFESLRKKGIGVSLFIDPNLEAIRSVHKLGIDEVELHTGHYAEACKEGEKTSIQKELIRLKDSAQYADELSIKVHVGHGLDYKNILPVAGIEVVEELNIGFAIIAQSVFVGIDKAVRDMIELIQSSSGKMACKAE